MWTMKQATSTFDFFHASMKPKYTELLQLLEIAEQMVYEGEKVEKCGIVVTKALYMILFDYFHFGRLPPYPDSFAQFIANEMEWIKGMGDNTNRKSDRHSPGETITSVVKNSQLLVESLLYMRPILGGRDGSKESRVYAELACVKQETVLSETKSATLKILGRMTPRDGDFGDKTMEDCGAQKEPALVKSWTISMLLKQRSDKPESIVIERHVEQQRSSDSSTSSTKPVHYRKPKTTRDLMRTFTTFNAPFPNALFPALLSTNQHAINPLFRMHLFVHLNRLSHATLLYVHLASSSASLLTSGEEPFYDALNALQLCCDDGDQPIVARITKMSLLSTVYYELQRHVTLLRLGCLYNYETSATSATVSGYFEHAFAELRVLKARYGLMHPASVVCVKRMVQSFVTLVKVFMVDFDLTPKQFMDRIIS
jgi:hypothetical protein